MIRLLGNLPEEAVRATFHSFLPTVRYVSYCTNYAHSKLEKELDDRKNNVALSILLLDA